MQNLSMLTIRFILFSYFFYSNILCPVDFDSVLKFSKERFENFKTESDRAVENNDNFRGILINLARSLENQDDGINADLWPDLKAHVIEVQEVIRGLPKDEGNFANLVKDDMEILDDFIKRGIKTFDIDSDDEDEDDEVDIYEFLQAKRKELGQITDRDVLTDFAKGFYDDFDDRDDLNDEEKAELFKFLNDQLTPKIEQISLDDEAVVERTLEFYGKFQDLEPEKEDSSEDENEDISLEKAAKEGQEDSESLESSNEDSSKSRQDEDYSEENKDESESDEDLNFQEAQADESRETIGEESEEEESDDAEEDSSDKEDNRSGDEIQEGLEDEDISSGKEELGEQVDDKETDLENESDNQSEQVDDVQGTGGNNLEEKELVGQKDGEVKEEPDILTTPKKIENESNQEYIKRLKAHSIALRKYYSDLE